MKKDNQNNINTEIAINSSSFHNKKQCSKVLEFFKGLGTIGLYFTLEIIGVIIFSNFLKSNNKIVVQLAELGTYLIMLSGLCFIYHKKIVADLKNFKKDNINVAIHNWLCGLLIMIVANILISFLVKDIAANETANRELLNNFPISSMLFMILIGPFIEEITFRLSFKKAFSKWYTFSIVTGIFFGFAHILASITPGFNPLELLYIIPYGTLGFFFAKAMFETDNIYTSFIAHMLHNALCILIIILF